MLLVNEWRRHIAEADTAAYLSFISGLDIDVDRSPDEGTIIALARRHSLTFYDSAYLGLAMRQDTPLATLDKKRAVAAKSEGIQLIG